MSGSAVWAATTFSDVGPDNPFRDEITWAADNGIADGYPDGTFRPGNTVTRQSAVAFLGRYNDQIEMVRAFDSVPGTANITRSIQCPAGKRAIAGGARSLGASSPTMLSASYPVDAIGNMADADATGWATQIQSVNGANQIITYGVWVTCAPARLPGD